MVDIDVYVNDFKTIYVKNSFDGKKLSDGIGVAFDKAYSDAKRTLSGIGKNKEGLEQAKNQIVDKFKSYFDKDDNNMDGFDTWHKDVCKIWCDKFKDSDIGTFGKAQKIVNMMFKYLYCCYCENNENKFKCCHMPLDSIILEWYKRKVRTDIKVKNISPWSKIEFEDDNDVIGYKTIRDNIKQYVSENYEGYSPLQIEFVIWKDMQRELLAESFLFAIDSSISVKERKEIKKNKLKDKLKRIREKLNEIINTTEEEEHNETSNSII